jgi:hypothetical protein
VSTTVSQRTVMMALALAGSEALSSTALRAQVRDLSPSTRLSIPVLIARKSGQPANRRVPPPPPPPSLTLSQLTAVLGTLGLSPVMGKAGVTVSGYQLTALGGRVRLELDRPDYVMFNQVSFALELEGAVGLVVSALAAGEQYIIDCTVKPGHTYQMTGPGVSMTFTGTNHLLALYKASDTGQAVFVIKGDGFWAFYSCLVSEVQ